VDTLWQDIRYSVRQLARYRQFSIAALLVLGLGIGANATIFGLMQGMLYRPLPGVAHSEQLVSFTENTVSYPMLRDLRADTRGVIDVAGMSGRSMTLSGDGRASLVSTQVVSGNYFQVAGVRASLGRLLGPDDDAPGAAPVAVLSDGEWQREFGGDRGVIGRRVLLNDRPVVVVGVAAPEFRGLWLESSPAFWVPMSAWPGLAPTNMTRLSLENRNWGWVRVFGRLAPGVTPAAAAKEMTASMERARLTYAPGDKADPPVVLQSSVEAFAGVSRSTIARLTGVLMGVVGIVLLLICANVANLLLARGSARQREVGVRIALGATRSRLMRQLLTESAVLAFSAVAVAFGIASLASDGLSRMKFGGASFAGLNIAPDGRTLAFMAALALASALVFGLAPARQTLAVDLTPSLRDGTAGAGQRRSRLRGALLAAQVALSLVLLVGAGLFTRALQRALTIDPGFAVGNVAVAAVNMGLSHYDAPRAAAYYAQAADRLTAVKDVTAFAWATDTPLSSGMDKDSFSIPGYTPPAGERLSVENAVVSAGYFQVLHVPVLAGRAFDEHDAPQSAPVVVINATMAAKYFPSGAVGRHISFNDVDYTIAGVVKDVAYHRLGEKPRPYLYGALSQHLGDVGLGAMVLFARTAGDPKAAAPQIRAALLGADAHVTPFAFGTLDDRLGEVLFPQRAGAFVLGAFSVLALIVALVGVHGVVSYAVSRRTREIGIRVALGARGDRVVNELVREHVPYIAAGVIAGLVLSAAGTRALASFLYGVSATDLPTFAGASLALAAAALLAAAIPARRAAKVDPMVALRYE
jgi:predicted permease